MIKLNDGETHKILFSCGKLYLDGKQIAGRGIHPSKDIMFEFKVSIEEKEGDTTTQTQNTSMLDISTHDSIDMGDIMFESKINTEETVEEILIPPVDSSTLEVKVHDNVLGMDVGPGQG